MSSLKDEVSKQSWANKNKLMFSHDSTENKIFLLVEGDSDRRFFYKIFNSLTDKIIIDSPDSGKPEVIRAVSEIRSWNNDNIYGICDTDFDYITEELKNYDQGIILFTDFHDLEITILSLGVFEDIFCEYTIFDNLKQTDAEKVKENIFRVSYDIGLLKLANVKHEYNLNFSRLVHSNYIKTKGIDIEFDINLMIDELIELSPNFDKDKNSNNILKSMCELKSCGYEELHICNGHDFCEILSIFYKQDFSKDRNLNRKKIESDLRLTCTIDRFNCSNLSSLLTGILQKHNIV